jgi:hypothetical protein
MTMPSEREQAESALMLALEKSLDDVIAVHRRVTALLGSRELADRWFRGIEPFIELALFRDERGSVH